MKPPDSTQLIDAVPHRVEVSWGTKALPREPTGDVLTGWLISAMQVLQCVTSEVSVRVVSVAEMTDLNTTYRGTPQATNVLSFENGITDDGGVVLLGDIVICNTIVCEESERFNKTFASRYAHLLVHGLLHLLGHDHIENDERETMEALEIKVVSQLGFDDPYEVTSR